VGLRKVRSRRVSFCLSFRLATLKFIITLKARRGQLSIGVVADQGPMALKPFIPERKIPFLQSFHVKEKDRPHSTFNGRTPDEVYAMQESEETPTIVGRITLQNAYRRRAIRTWPS
jgi:hypothetical protein